MDIKELLNATPEDLAGRQEEAMVDFTVTVLRNIADLISDRQYESARGQLDSSPSGDETGCHNRYIDFSLLGSNIEDLGDVLDRLITLRELQKKKK